RGGFATAAASLRRMPAVLGDDGQPTTIVSDVSGAANRSPERVAATLRESLPRLLLAGSPVDPGDHLRPGRDHRSVGGARPRLRRPPGRRAVPRRPFDLDVQRVLAAPSRLPLGARSPAR